MYKLMIFLLPCLPQTIELPRALHCATFLDEHNLSRRYTKIQASGTLPWNFLEETNIAPAAPKPVHGYLTSWQTWPLWTQPSELKPHHPLGSCPAALPKRIERTGNNWKILKKCETKEALPRWSCHSPGLRLLSSEMHRLQHKATSSSKKIEIAILRI